MTLAVAAHQPQRIVRTRDVAAMAAPKRNEPPAAAPAPKAGPVAKAGALQPFRGYVATSVGDVFVDVKPGKNDKRPLVFLDGLDANGRKLPTDDTVVTIHLRGQLMTLKRDLEKNRGASVQQDITPESQVAAVVGALDALGIKGAVDVLGLSYGGMIAALAKKAHPERFGQLLLCSPYAHSTAMGDPVRDTMHALLLSPWNPMGQLVYRMAARASLAAAVAMTPPELWTHAAWYPEAMYRMSMGLEGRRLEDEIAGMKDVHLLVAPADPISPPLSNKIAIDKASGTFTMAPWLQTMQHDLVTFAPHVVRDFIAKSRP